MHYHAYLKAASRNDSRACDAMASELTLIHGVPPGCDEREYPARTAKCAAVD